MERIVNFIIWSVILILGVNELSSIKFMLVCVVFCQLYREADGIIQNYKLDKKISFKKIPVIELFRLSLFLLLTLIFCICKWTGII